MERIVVGVDGSDQSLAALEWAMTEGRVRGAVVEVVHAFMPDLSEVGLVNDPGTARREAEELLRKMAEPALVAHPGVQVTTRELEGPSARTLLDAAAGADLLVVGSRGRGGFAGLMLGSVSQQCVHHAPCPVVVVPPGA
ncbi:MAG TPA: universal stress protein [Acidimicrobiia bacterium]|jgi:nucleotide-binding universal stress UspA family protein|nr:universal stress protein [Acidimicrobiia bacterium]